MDNQERETIQDLPNGWSVKYFDPTDPDYFVEYSNGPYLLRVTGGGLDFNLQLHKGDYIEDNVNIIDLDKTNEYALKLMNSISDLDSIEESFRAKKPKNMTKKITLNELRRLVEQVLSESGPDEDIEITITKDEPDERRPERKLPPTYTVDYVCRQGDGMLQFSGSLKPYHTGRDYEYEFEPSWFQDKDSESYFDDNWEEIEDQVLEKLYSLSK